MSLPVLSDESLLRFYENIRKQTDADLEIDETRLQASLRQQQLQQKIRGKPVRGDEQATLALCADRLVVALAFPSFGAARTRDPTQGAGAPALETIGLSVFTGASSLVVLSLRN